MQKKEDLTAWITGLVERFLAKSPLNNLRNKDGAPAWDEALVGFASGADPLLLPECRQVISCKQS
jgi:hypothetical protein